MGIRPPPGLGIMNRPFNLDGRGEGGFLILRIDHLISTGGEGGGRDCRVGGGNCKKLHNRTRRKKNNLHADRF